MGSLGGSPLGGVCGERERDYKRIENVYGKKDVSIFFPPHSVDTTAPVEPIPGLEEFTESDDYF